MDLAVVTGSAGLIGAESVRFFSGKGVRVIGIDNDMRARFFGKDASTDWCRRELESTIPDYRHYEIDIRDWDGVLRIFAEYGNDIRYVIHTAAQPSHDWAVREPHIDFSVNAVGTLNLLEATRRYASDASFIFTSTNKVYGDKPNCLPLVECETRWEVHPSHAFAKYGIDETMAVDQTTHSLFGVSKLAADSMVQEYGRYFGMKTVCFRGGCLTGPGQSGAMLHGFLSYLIKCAHTGKPYTIFGYKGKQVRDNIHSFDLVNMFWHYCQDPRPGEVYNAGGGRQSNCSILEAIAIAEQVAGRKMNITYVDQNRVGDHIWYISDIRKFQSHYPGWSYRYDLQQIMREICEAMSKRL